MISIRALLLAVAMLGLAACASSAPVEELPPGDPLSDALGRPEYRLGPGDLLKVQVFQIPDLDRDIRIDNAGRISLPLIGSVEAAGLDIARLQERIAARYRERYLQDPQVTVSLQESPTQRVTVGGAVTEPGVYPMEAPHLTLQQAVAMSRGITNVANPRNVIVFRTVGGKRVFARFDLKQIQEGALDDPDIHGGDIVIVDVSGVRTVLRTLVELTPFLAVWRAYR
ncbi:polysaccharide biosynthesis/export family protein [Lysobacter sp. M15]|uniref:polysaccharide biosynthesis/export family protein n=1 Tax=Lysobacter sp. M15 TaxID=2916837 RepID=UPI001F586B25|nr:polysaccharide biosynthesis/export family protein [Lysobacter sp. M15]